LFEFVGGGNESHKEKEKYYMESLWNHCESVFSYRLLVKCKYLSHIVGCSVGRINHQFTRTKKNFIACIYISKDIRDTFLKLLEDKEKKNTKEENRQYSNKKRNIVDIC